jgi:hypothetical protein
MVVGFVNRFIKSITPSMNIHVIAAAVLIAAGLTVSANAQLFRQGSDKNLTVSNITSHGYLSLSGATNRVTVASGALKVDGAAVGSSGTAGTVINTVAASGLLSVDASKTNGIAATAAHVDAAIAGGALTVGGLTNTAWTADRVLVSGADKTAASSPVTATTLEYLDATSSVQTQLDAKQAKIFDASAGLIYPTGTTPGGTAPITIRESDGGIWIGANAWQDVPLNTGNGWPLNAVSMVSSNEHVELNFQLLVLDDEDYGFFSSISGNADGSPTSPTAALTLNAAGTNTSERVSFYLDPANAALPWLVMQKDGVDKLSINHSGSITGNGNTYSFTSGLTDNATNVALVVDTAVPWVTDTGLGDNPLLLTLGSAGTNKVRFQANGGVTIGKGFPDFWGGPIDSGLFIYQDARIGDADDIFLGAQAQSSATNYAYSQFTGMSQGLLFKNEVIDSPNHRVNRINFSIQKNHTLQVFDAAKLDDSATQRIGHFEPTAADGTTAWQMDTLLTHTTGSLFHVANNTANKFSVAFSGATTAAQVATEPAAPAAGYFTLFGIDNGSGKMILKVRFPTGASQTLATEP